MDNFNSLSKKLNVTPNAVRQHVRKMIHKDNDLIKHIKFTAHHKYNFDKKLSEIIRKSFEYTNTKKHETSTNLEKQLEDKQNQINHLNTQLEHEQTENIALTGELHSTRQTYLTYKKEHSHGFWWKLFH